MEILILSVLIVIAWNLYRHHRRAEQDRHLRIEITVKQEGGGEEEESFDREFLKGLKIKDDEEAG